MSAAVLTAPVLTAPVLTAPAQPAAPALPTTAPARPTRGPLPGPGDDRAWAEVVSRYTGLLRGVTRRSGLPRDEADDVVQETWVRFFSCAGDLRDPECVPGWLATTARRECLARSRKQWRETPTHDGTTPEVVSEAPDPLERWAASQEAAALRVAVRALPARERALVELLLEPEPVSYSEISRRLVMPVGSIGPVRGRALRRLRGLLAPACEVAAR